MLRRFSPSVRLSFLLKRTIGERGGDVIHFALRQLFQYVHVGGEQLLLWSLFNHGAMVLPWLPNRAAIAATRSADLPTRGDSYLAPCRPATVRLLRAIGCDRLVVAIVVPLDDVLRDVPPQPNAIAAASATAPRTIRKVSPVG